MKERLQKILSARGVCSRRDAEKLIAAGRVSVDGAAASIGMSADPEVQEITVDGRPLPGGDEPCWLMLHKPRGVLTAMRDDRGRTTVWDLVRDCGVRVYPVGRLDFDSEGLLLMTNDGELANAIMHPSGGIRKTYLAYVAGDARAALPRLREPMEIDGRTVCAKAVSILDINDINGEQARIFLTIGEGRNRQIRRMCARCGLTVTRLVRVAEGSLELGDLESGKWRRLTPEEIALLRSDLKENKPNLAD